MPQTPPHPRQTQTTVDPPLPEKLSGSGHGMTFTGILNLAESASSQNR